MGTLVNTLSLVVYCTQVAKNVINAAFKFTSSITIFSLCVSMTVHRNEALSLLVRLTQNCWYPTENYYPHKTGPDHTNRTSAALSRAPLPAILDDDLTWQLGWKDPPACGTQGRHRVPVCVCVSAFTCESRVGLKCACDEKQGSFNSHCGKKFHNGFLHITLA